MGIPYSSDMALLRFAVFGLLPECLEPLPPPLLGEVVLFGVVVSARSAGTTTPNFPAPLPTGRGGQGERGFCNACAVGCMLKE